MGQAVSIAELTPGTHSCLIYDKYDDQTKVTCEFLTRGLTRGELCVFLESPERLGDIRQELARVGVDVAAEEARGALILSPKMAYLEEGHFKGDRIIQFLEDALKSALANGFTALRATGDINWELGEEQDFNVLIDYEARLDRFVTKNKIVGLCQYRRRTIPGNAIANALETHQNVMLGQQFCSNNLYYESPDIRLAPEGLATQERRVDWMCRRLSQAMQADRQRDNALRALVRSEETLAQVNQELERRVMQQTKELQSTQESLAEVSRQLQTRASH